MSFEEFEGTQDGIDPRQYPGGLPLGMRIVNLAAKNSMPQSGGTGMPAVNEQQQPFNPSRQIVDLGPQVRMPSRINLPVSTEPVGPSLSSAGFEPQYQRRVLDGLLGISRLQNTVQSTPTGQSGEVVDMTPQVRAPSRIPRPGQTAAPAQSPLPGPNQTAQGNRNQAHGTRRGHQQPTVQPVQNLEEQLRRDEGTVRDRNRRMIAYNHDGNWTIGYGHNLTAHNERRPNQPITDQQAEAYLQQDIQRATQELDQALPWARNLDATRRGALINMVFNMGIGDATRGTGVLGFRNALDAIQAGDYDRAAQEMRNSRWGRGQTRNRAGRLAEQIRTGHWQ